MLSQRADRLMYDEEYVKQYSDIESIRNPYHPTTNPEGIVNIGTAISGLMDDILVNKFRNSTNLFEVDSSLFRYYQFYGPDSFRKKMAELMTLFFKPVQPILPENLLVANGALVLVDVISGMLLNELEYVMIPVPAYQGYFQALTQRWNLNVSTIPTKYNKSTGKHFDIDIEDVRKKYEEETRNGHTVKAFLLNNPNNPSGRVFSKEFVLDVMNFCQKNNLHLIADEMYCMSVFDSKVEFHSVLELEGESTLEKDKLHVIWGFSKDFCLTSFRTGIVHTYNPKLQKALKAMSQFQAAPLPILKILENFVSDLDWIKNTFIPTNHKRLLEAYSNAKKLMNSINIETTETNAGFFFLANLRPFMRNPDRKSTEELFKKFKKYKVYVVPYWEMRVTEPGWFRIVFTVEIPVFCKGFERFRDALTEWASETGVNAFKVSERRIPSGNMG